MFLPLFSFLVDTSGHEKKLLLSHQLSRAKEDSSNPTFRPEPCSSERVPTRVGEGGVTCFRMT